MSEPRTQPKHTVIGLVRRAGWTEETVAALERTLPDPVDLDRDAALLERFGVDRNALISALGGSP